MSLTKLTFSHYRCFREEQQMRLGALTLLYGRNSSGKSAILRLPSLLAQSMDGAPGLDLSNLAVNGASFRDLRWRGPAEDGEPLVLGLEFDDARPWRWELDWRGPPFDEVVPYVIEGPRSGDGVARASGDDAPGGDTSERLTWAQASRSETGPRRTYLMDDGGKVALELHGLRPSEDAARLDTSDLRTFTDSVLWLSANREGPSRFGVPLGARFARSHIGGAWAEAHVHRDKDLRGRVSKWFEAHASCRVVAAATPESMQRLRLQALTENGPDIPFPDVGEGLQQVFPVLVALELLRSQGGLLCVEEPESHLHPALQRALVDRMAEVLEANPEAQVMLETHSELFLYAVLLHAVQSLRERVRLHWVSSEEDGSSDVREIRLDGDGRPEDDTLLQAFADMGVLRRELLAARRAHAG